MAEGQQIQKANGMHEAFVLQILLHLRFQRRDVRKNISMGNHDTLGLGGGARSENNLQRVIAVDVRWAIGCGCVRG